MSKEKDRHISLYKAQIKKLVKEIERRNNLIELAHLRGWQDREKSGQAKYNVTASLERFKKENNL